MKIQLAMKYCAKRAVSFNSVYSFIDRVRFSAGGGDACEVQRVCAAWQCKRNQTTIQGVSRSRWTQETFSPHARECNHAGHGSSISLRSYTTLCAAMGHVFLFSLLCAPITPQCTHSLSRPPPERQLCIEDAACKGHWPCTLRHPADTAKHQQVTAKV